MVEYSTIKNFPHNPFDLFTVSSYNVGTGALIGMNGKYGRINFKIGGAQPKIDISTNLAVDKGKLQRLPRIGNYLGWFDSLNFKFVKNIWNND